MYLTLVHPGLWLGPRLHQQMQPVGNSVLQNKAIGLINTASGYRALFSNTTGRDNTVRSTKPFPKLIPEGRASWHRPSLDNPSIVRRRNRRQCRGTSHNRCSTSV
jgi:hypothetical protein